MTEPPESFDLREALAGYRVSPSRETSEAHLQMLAEVQAQQKPASPPRPLPLVGSLVLVAILAVGAGAGVVAELENEGEQLSVEATVPLADAPRPDTSPELTGSLSEDQPTSPSTVAQK